MEAPTYLRCDSFHSQDSHSSALRTRQTMDNFRRMFSKNSRSNKKQSNIFGTSNRDLTNPFQTTQPTRRPPPSMSSHATEAPPPYSPAPTDSPAIVAPQAQVIVGDDSPFAFLGKFDTIFLIDDSGSMAGRSWREVSGALAAIAPICTQFDADGIDIYFLNHRNPRTTDGGYVNITTPEAVRELFQTVRPLGSTPTGERLGHILKPYLRKLENSLERQGHGHEATVKPLNIIVVTDGVPTDEPETVIVNAARKLDSYNAETWQVGIQFFQVGSEPEAAETLKDLDDVLSKTYNIRDMVDTVPYDPAAGNELTARGLLKVCLGSVVRRLDRRIL